MKKTEIIAIVVAVLVVVMVFQQYQLTNAIKDKQTDTKVDNTSKDNNQQENKLNAQLAELTKTLKDTNTGKQINTEPKKVEVSSAVIEVSKMSDPVIRQHAAQILARLISTESEDRLVEMAQKDSDYKTREYALAALASQKSTKLLPVLVHVLKTGDEEQCMNASNAIAKAPQAKYVPDVIALLSKFKGAAGKNTSITNNLLTFLQKTADPAAVNGLYELLKKETDLNRAYQLAFTMIKCATRAEIPVLIKSVKVRKDQPLASTSRDPLVPLIQTLGKLNDRRATADILEFVDSRNTYVQREAVLALSKLKDILAAKQLIQLVPTMQSFNKHRIETSFKDGYPGVKFNEKSQKWEMTDAKEVEMLMKERANEIARLEKMLE